MPMVGPVEVARMVAGVAQSEMHIGLRTQAFGSVEVHTVVRDSQVGLSVGSERGDLRTFLATEVSGLPASIQAKASATVTMAQTAITTNSAASLNGNGNGPADAVALYCGQNR